MTDTMWLYLFGLVMNSNYLIGETEMDTKKLKEKIKK